MNDQGLGRLEPRELLRAVGLRVTAPRLALETSLAYLAMTPAV